MIKFRESMCPKCGGHIPMSWLSMWSWCSKCSRVWRVTQDATKAEWWYAKSVTLDKVHDKG